MKRGTRGWIAAMAMGIALFVSGQAAAEFYINEIFFNVGGAGDDYKHEYIELRGPADASLDNVYLLFLENELPGGLGDKAGVVERIFDLNTRTMGSNGFLTLRQKSSPYTIAPGTTDLVNTGTGAGWGNGPGSSTIGASTNGDLQLEGGGFTAMLIRNDSGSAPELNMDLDFEVDNDDNPLTAKDGLDYPGMGRPGWTILDSVGIFAEPEETETGRLYGQVNYAVFDQFIDPNFVPQIEPGSEFQPIYYEVEYLGRWGNSTGHALSDWHISNFTDKAAAGSTSLADWRQSGDPHPSNINAPPSVNQKVETNQFVPYRAALSDTLGAANYPANLAELPWDYNKNGVVDAADYTVWRDSVGQTGPGLAADYNGDQVVNQKDYDAWRFHFGLEVSALGAAQVLRTAVSRNRRHGCCHALGLQSSLCKIAVGEISQRGDISGGDSESIAGEPYFDRRCGRMRRCN